MGMPPEVITFNNYLCSIGVTKKWVVVARPLLENMELNLFLKAWLKSGEFLVNNYLKIKQYRISYTLMC